MRKYFLILINQDPALDLRKYLTEWDQIKDYILAGGKTKKLFNDVTSINIINVQKNYIEIDVDENGSYWHDDFGHTAVLHYSYMRILCSTSDQTDMFKWK